MSAGELSGNFYVRLFLEVLFPQPFFYYPSLANPRFYHEVYLLRQERG